MGFWSGYWASLKPLEVEEPIDVYVHRPLAYILARGLLQASHLARSRSPFSRSWPDLRRPLRSSPSSRTICRSGGGLLFASAVLDCADGQLARMRGTSSLFGRMLDGCADLFTVGRRGAGDRVGHVALARHTPVGGHGARYLRCITIVTTSFHTTMYDHYKNVFLRLTGPYQEGEDYEAARARYEAKRADALARCRASATRSTSFT